MQNGLRKPLIKLPALTTTGCSLPLHELATIRAVSHHRCSDMAATLDLPRVGNHSPVIDEECETQHMAQQDEETMQIGEVAERTQLSLRTLRHYDQVGLVPPSARSEGGFRLYTEADVERLNHVRRITPLGFSLEETAEILKLLEGQDSTTSLDEVLERAQKARDKMARKLRQADEFISTLQDMHQAQAQ